MITAYQNIYSSPADRARFEQLSRKLCGLGHGPEQIRYFSAPGRTELCGNHTDHQNGRVLAAAVDVDTVAAAAENGTDRIRLDSEGFPPCELSVHPEQNTDVPAGTTAALLAGMISVFAPLCELRGLDLCASSTVLPGGGLSSSASVEVLLAEIFSDYFGLGLGALDLAALGQKVENEFFGKPCGLLDQAACAAGGISYLDFGDPEKPKLEKLRFDPERFGYSLFLISCGADHADLTAEYAAIPAELREISAVFGARTLSQVDEAAFWDRIPELRERCSDRAVLRAIHIFDENRRVDRMRRAILDGDFSAYLSVVRESGLSSWRFLQNIAPRGSLFQPMALTLALCEKLLGGDGACRVHGGGFAGTAQAYVPFGLADSFPDRLERLLPTASCQRRRFRPAGATEITL